MPKVHWFRSTWISYRKWSNHGELPDSQFHKIKSDSKCICFARARASFGIWNTTWNMINLMNSRPFGAACWMLIAWTSSKKWTDSNLKWKGRRTNEFTLETDLAQRSRPCIRISLITVTAHKIIRPCSKWKVHLFGRQLCVRPSIVFIIVLLNASKVDWIFKISRIDTQHISLVMCVHDGNLIIS